MPTASPQNKPDRPYADFPLFAHRNGQWCRTIKGKQHYFGVWSDWEGALKKYGEQKDDLFAGRAPSTGEGTTLVSLVNQFLTSKKRKLQSKEKEIGERTFNEYYTNCKRVLKVLGKRTHVDQLRPDDFAKLRADFATTHGVKTLEGDISRSRALFNYAKKNLHINVHFGDEFNKPTRTVLKKHRRAQPKKFYEPKELRDIIAAASLQMRAMIYLGLNCGLGNSDCAHLTLGVINWKTKWLGYARGKTGVNRRCPLWPETVKALREAIEHRPTPKIECDNVFITRLGMPWMGKELLISNENKKTKRDDPVSKEFTKLLVKLKLKRQGVGFYALRHIFYTVGKRFDREAAKAMMGHADKSNDMGPIYDEDDQPVEDERLMAVSNYVRKWLTGKTR
jgi:integrase